MGISPKRRRRLYTKRRAISPTGCTCRALLQQIAASNIFHTVIFLLGRLSRHIWIEVFGLVHSFLHDSLEQPGNSRGNASRCCLDSQQGGLPRHAEVKCAFSRRERFAKREHAREQEYKRRTKETRSMHR